jgi:hypothetical protein
MHVLSLLHKTFKEQLPHAHLNRLNSLMTACSAAVSSNQLHLTGLGRSISNTNKESSNIQKVDRLLGNGLLQGERASLYKVMRSYLLTQGSSPWIHIDWSCINSTTHLYVLRASLSMKGRSVVLWEECHPKKNENNHATHKEFLNKLKDLLLPGMKPVIVTDAGFRAPWFAYILKLGWDFVGRLRNKNLVYLDKAGTWSLSSTYFKQATSVPAYLGEGLLTGEGKVPVQCVLFKGKSKGRHKINKNKKTSQSGKSKQYAAANKEPWFLVTSLEAKQKPVLITNIYRQRMRIEENIRDTKCTRYGLGLKNSLTRCSQRMNILLLIAAIVTLAAWIAGIYIRNNGNASDFQAQSAQCTSALSIVFLGRRVLKKGLNITKQQFQSACRLLYNLVLKTQQESPHYD